VQFKELVSQHKNEIAAIIIEPVAGNMGCILPKSGFMEGFAPPSVMKKILFSFLMK
jgi:glutamate-1-semialdehyde 2,1-aminomutase